MTGRRVSQKQNIANYLALHRKGQPVYVGEIVRGTGLSIGQVGRALTRLTSAGAVTVSLCATSPAGIGVLREYDLYLKEGLETAYGRAEAQ